MPESLVAIPSAAESARFGHLTARISVPTELSPDDAGTQLRSALEFTDAAIVVVRYPSESLGLIAEAAISDGWVSYPGGSLLYWQAPTEPANDGSGTRELDAEARSARAAELDAALRDSFSGYLNHYAANPLIAADAAVEGYAEWSQTIAADPENRVFIVEDEQGIVGVAVITSEHGVWDINLAGVVARAQRRGHYRRLISGIVAAAADADTTLIISTQTHNIAVQRAWAREGFLPIRSVDTAHLVRRDVLTPRS